jgi:hypothetical protein
VRTNRIALASGVLPEFGPLDIIAAARAADFDAVGLWVELAEWTGATTRDAKAALAQNGLDLIDVEVVWIKPKSLVDDHKRTLDIGVELGAKNLLCVSSDPGMSATAAKFAALCEHSPGVRVALEFGIFTEVRNLAMARSVIDAVNHPLAAILIDSIHVDRSGTAVAEIAALQSHLLPDAQFCDAPAEQPNPNDFDAIITDAIDLRMQCGMGALPLAALLDAMPPGIPLSIGLRSKALRDNFPDPADRARKVSRATRAWLAL